MTGGGEREKNDIKERQTTREEEKTFRGNFRDEGDERMRDASNLL